VAFDHAVEEELDVAAVQPPGSDCATEYPEPVGTSFRVIVLERVPSESSSSEKLVGESPPPAVKEKSCGSLGTESRTTTTLPRLWSVNVQVTFSPESTSMLPTGLPSSQAALARSHPAGVDCETEYPTPGVTWVKTSELLWAGSRSSSSRNVVGPKPSGPKLKPPCSSPIALNEKSWASSGIESSRTVTVPGTLAA